MVKQLKNANSAMKEQTEKEIAATKEERRILIQTLEDINNKYREIYNMYMKSKMENNSLQDDQDSKEVIKSENSKNEEEIKSLRNEIEALKNELKEREEEKKATIQEFESLNK